MKWPNATRVVFLFSVFVLGGCQRGCLKTWLEERGVGARPEAPPKAGVPLHGIDCPDGLARCVGGSVEVSRLARVPDPCVGRPAECACPWDVVATCPRGCVADELVVDITASLSATQLCALDDGEAVARAITSATRVAYECGEDDNHVCVAGTVAHCELSVADGARRARPVATCLLGCADDGATLEDIVDDRQATALLCARAPAPK